MIRTSFFGGNLKSEDGNRSDKIQMSALGRRFQLGTIYDYRSDSIIPGMQTYKSLIVKSQSKTLL